jgi:hypothetical protein
MSSSKPRRCTRGRFVSIRNASRPTSTSATFTTTSRAFPEALSAYRDALAINPGYPEAHFYLAVTLEKLGRSADARPHWKQYKDLAPDGEFVALAKEFSDTNESRVPGLPRLYGPLVVRKVSL